MKTWIIDTLEKVVLECIWSVRAETEEEALEKFHNGERHLLKDVVATISKPAAECPDFELVEIYQEEGEVSEN